MRHPIARFLLLTSLLATLRAHRARLIAALALGLTIALGLSVRSQWADLPRDLSKPLGVALWAMAAYWSLLLLRPSLRPLHIAALALALSWAIELLQLTPISRSLSAQHPALRLIFGETFSPPDLLYLLGGVLLSLAIHALSRRVASRS